MPKAAKKPAKDKVIELIEKMTVLELSELVGELKEKFQVTPSVAPVAVAAAPAAEAEPVEEKTEFSVVLTAVGDKKIQVIKEVRAITGLGLKEAKALVDSAPKSVKDGIPREEAESTRAKLEEAGATVEVR